MADPKTPKTYLTQYDPVNKTTTYITNDDAEIENSREEIATLKERNKLLAEENKALRRAIACFLDLKRHLHKVVITEQSENAQDAVQSVHQLMEEEIDELQLAHLRPQGDPEECKADFARAVT